MQQNQQKVYKLLPVRISVVVATIVLCRDLSFGRVKNVIDGYKYGWTGKKRSSKTIDIVSYAPKVSVNGVTCVFVVHFRNWL